MSSVRNQSGLTLVEALVAMAITVTFLIPLNFWFQKNAHNQRPFDNYIASQLLERELNRAQTEKRERRSETVLKMPKYYKVSIAVKSDGEGYIYTGTVQNINGQVLVRQVKARYH